LNEGETYLWHRLAHRLKQPLYECQEETSSTDFIRWNEFLNREEWETHTKDQHQMAMVAYEVHRLTHVVASMFVKKGTRLPEIPPFEEFLIKFGTKGEPKEEEIKAVIVNPEYADPHVPGNFEKGYGLSGIEVGQPLDEKWQKVNDRAKATWTAIIPPDCIVTE